MYLEKMTDMELLSLSDEVTQEMHSRARSKLEETVEYYIGIFGSEQGMEQLAECLFQDVAQKVYPEKWAGLVSHINKISG